MGGEGVTWAGIAPFTDEKHIFVNLGDGTYFHSGLLAIRQAVAAKVNVTYKILYNDAVAMTGGQHVDGALTPQQVTHQLFHEGVRAIHLVSDHPEVYSQEELAPGTVIEHRDEMDSVMRTLRETAGCTAIVYVQTCAAEKRRRRRRGTLDDPPRRIVINSDVCEGCGDCSVQSNCISVEPLETEFGRKRVINQSGCNKDYSCVNGFCPSFVSVDGGSIRKRAPIDMEKIGALPEPPASRPLESSYNIAIAGVGGTGVLTIGGLLGMAAHLEGKASMILDMSGLAQKGGAVLSHVRIAQNPDEVTSSRIVTGTADLLLAADEVVAVARDTIELCAPERTQGVINTHLIPIADFVRHRDFDFQRAKVTEVLERSLAPDPVFYDFTKAAEALLGDSIATNVMMLGFACQKGLLPVSAEAVERAITLNGVSIRMNTLAFALGRLAAADPARLISLMHEEIKPQPTLDDMSLDQIVAHRSDFLIAYQNVALATRYRRTVDLVRDAAKGMGEALPRAVAINYAKLLAYKDEYEVARLYTDGSFETKIREQFEGDFKLRFHLAPPILPGRDSSGRPKKRVFGAWIVPLFRLLASLRGLRGTLFDPFAYSADRRLERKLIADYEADVASVLARLSPGTMQTAVALLALPDQIRGYGPVKAAAVEAVQSRRKLLLEQLADPPGLTPRVAAE
jgi:indolepyruvate ferredoxin oxidoreductase